MIVNRARRSLLTAVDAGRVGRTVEGRIMRRGHNTGRCDGAVRELVAADWVRLGPDGGTYQLTDAGRAALDGAP